MVGQTFSLSALGRPYSPQGQGCADGTDDKPVFAVLQLRDSNFVDRLLFVSHECQLPCGEFAPRQAFRRNHMDQGRMRRSVSRPARLPTIRGYIEFHQRVRDRRLHRSCSTNRGGGQNSRKPKRRRTAAAWAANGRTTLPWTSVCPRRPVRGREAVSTPAHGIRHNKRLRPVVYSNPGMVPVREARTISSTVGSSNPAAI